MNIELERQAFEAWADQQWPGAKRQQLERDEYGQYKNAIYRDFWTGWQARATRPAQTEQQPIGYLTAGDRFIRLAPGIPPRHDDTPLYAAPIAQTAPQGKFRMGDRVKKSTGSEWVGRVVGWYSTEQTPEGYAVESSAHRNSVQIYPVTALEAVE